jgi:hypothetical protein
MTDPNTAAELADLVARPRDSARAGSNVIDLREARETQDVPHPLGGALSPV